MKGFQELVKKLVGPKAMPATQIPVQRPHYADDSTDDDYWYYTVRGEAFNKAYSLWYKTKTLEDVQVLSVAPESFVANLDNRSGYVREFCLRGLALHDWKESFKLTLQRLNDYVPGNRSLALQLVLKWLDEIPAAALVDALPALSAIASQSRVDHAAVQAAVARKLEEEEGRDALLAGLMHQHAKVRRECWIRCLQKFAWTGSERIEIAMRCGDSGIATSVESDVYALPDDVLLTWFDRTQQVRAMPLRRAFLVALRRKELIDAQLLVDRALWDRSYSIRWLARHWSKDNKQELVAAYRRVLSEQVSPRLRRYALEGLGQVGQADTIDCLEAGLQDANPALRRAAVDALCNYASATRYEFLIRALKSGDVAVIRKCFDLSLKTGDHLAYEDLLPIAQARNQELDFFVHLVDYARHLPVWLGIHVASLSRFGVSTVQAPLKPHVNAFLDRWARQQMYTAASKKQWADVCAWLPYESLNSQSLLRFALEGEARRMKTRG